MKGILGKKLGMMQIFDKEGNIIPVTVIQAGPSKILQKKTEETDGYRSIQIAFGEKKHTTKPLLGHLKKSGLKKAPLWITEIRNAEGDVGEILDVSLFSEGDKIKITGWTKGRGFTGGMKRWGWHGGSKTHGSMFHRRMGSVGQAAYPGEIWKGKTMPGHYGNERVTVKNLKIIKIDKEKNLLFVKGAVPGSKGGKLIIKKVD